MCMVRALQQHWPDAQLGSAIGCMPGWALAEVPSSCNCLQSDWWYARSMMWPLRGTNMVLQLCVCGVGPLLIGLTMGGAVWLASTCC
jgi:hypothetical protein